MGKKSRLRLHFVTILAIAVFAFLALGSGASTPKPAATSEEKIVSSVTRSEGTVYNIPRPEEKPYEALGLVFATSVSKYDPEGLEVSSQEGIVTMLLREAQKLGADDILNLRVDTNTVYTQTTETTAASGKSSSSGSSSSSSTSKKVITTRTVTYTGSALAIKYGEGVITSDNDNLYGGKFVPGKVIIEGTIEEEGASVGSTRSAMPQGLSQAAVQQVVPQQASASAQKLR